MNTTLGDVESPPPLSACTPEEILLGPYTEPIDRIARYSDKKFEELIEEWAFYYLRTLKKEYKRVRRLGGAGDMGRDVIGYVDTDVDPIVIDVYQCKHYGRPLQPGDFWPELAKLCILTFEKKIPLPRKYYITAPQDCGPTLSALLDKPDDLKRQFIRVWKSAQPTKPIYKSSGQKKYPLKGKLESYVKAFDFGRVTCKPIMEIVDELRNIPHRYAPRFGGGLIKPPPIDLVPPDDIAESEAMYVECLLSAYRDHKHDDTITRKALSDYLLDHFKISRERFYCAETIREFSRDGLPEPFTFSQVQNEVYYTIFDTVQRRDFTDGYHRSLEAATVAARTQVNHPLRTYLKVSSLQGICHQLANEGRVKWVV